MFAIARIEASTISALSSCRPASSAGKIAFWTSDSVARAAMLASRRSPLPTASAEIPDFGASCRTRYGSRLKSHQTSHRSKASLSDLREPIGPVRAGAESGGVEAGRPAALGALPGCVGTLGAGEELLEGGG